MSSSDDRRCRLFDEAFDADERTLISEVVIPTGDFEVLAVSPLGIAFRQR